MGTSQVSIVRDFLAIRVLAAISEKPIDIWQALEHRLGDDVNTYLSGCDEEVARALSAVADGGQLGVHANLGSVYQASMLPFDAGRVHCTEGHPAWLSREWIITIFVSPCSVARPAIIRAKLPFSLHRFQRLFRVLCVPYFAGASLSHRRPEMFTALLSNSGSPCPKKISGFWSWWY